MRNASTSSGSDAMADGIIPTDELVGLRDRVAVITGAGSGIGRASARCDWRRRVHRSLPPMCAATPPKPPRHRCVTPVAKRVAVAADVRDDARCRSALATEAIAALGQIDIVVNGAGIFPPSPMFEMTVDAWDRVLQINARGTFLVSRACAAHMSGGAIVNIASKSALQPTVGLAHYAASKGAVVMLTKSLALELAP